MSKTSIEWCDSVWNPVSGCTRQRRGCDNCYAVMMTKRLEAMGQEKYSGLVNIGKGHFNGVVKCHEDALTIPLKARKPRRWFVNSMSDLFHKEVPFAFIDRVFAVMALCPQHTFQVLTKRPERMAEYLTQSTLTGFRAAPETWQQRVRHHAADIEVCLGCVEDGARSNRAYRINEGQLNLLNPPLPNVWLGTSVEDQKTADERIPHLLRCPAAVRFLSCGPLLGPVDLKDATGVPPFGEDEQFGARDCIHWVIVGGESGPGARPMHPDWARSLRDQCAAAGVPFFFKQVGEWDCYEPSNPLWQSSYSHRAVDPVTFPVAVDCNHLRDWQVDFEGRDIVVHHRVGKRKAGRLLDGRTWDEFPEVAR